MNEREAIAFILQELKEQRRADFDMYFEMRKNTTAQYERFLNRLREIDERDAEQPKVEVLPEPGLIIPKSLTADLMKAYHEAEPGKILPEPRFKGTESELRVDKYEDTGTYKERVSMEDAVETIEQYLKDVKKLVGLGDIQMHTEKVMNTHWANFSTVMRRAVSVSPFIKVHKISQRKFLYSYKEE